MALSSHAMFPFDIVEMVIESLFSDEDYNMASLKACSLTCRTFLTTCRKHIFSKIVLSSPERYVNFDRLLDINPSIANYVRILHYDKSAVAPPFYSKIDSVDYCLQAIHHTYESRILQRLHRVTLFELAFDNHNWKAMTSTAFESSLSFFIQSNSIVNLTLTSILNLPISIFTYFPHLKELTITGVSFADAPLSDNFQNPKGPPKLVSLFILNCQWNTVAIEHFSPTPGVDSMLDLRRLEEFSFGHIARPIKLPIIEYLLKPSEALKSIKIHGYDLGLQLGSIASSLSPGSLKTLKTLILVPHLRRTTDDPYLHITAELEQIAGKNVLENLIIEPFLLMDDPCTFDPAVWSQLDLVLSQPDGFPFLRRVELNISLPGDGHSSDSLAHLEAIGKDHFPWLINNKQLEFCCKFENWYIPC